MEFNRVVNGPGEIAVDFRDNTPEKFFELRDDVAFTNRELLIIWQCCEDGVKRMIEQHGMDDRSIQMGEMVYNIVERISMAFPR
jgi:hypothetical protein